MRAVVYRGRTKLEVADVPDPKIIDPTDAIIKVTSSAICGSDLHLYGGYIPGMENGDVMGHEFMGEVVETGGAVTHIKPGDRVIIPFHISCGECFFCRKRMYSACDRTNPNKEIMAKVYGQSSAGMYAYSHLTGGFDGGQAEYVRVKYAHFNAFKVPEEFTDEQALFLTDILPTGYQAAEQCDIEHGDTVAVWGAGPVGQFAARSAQMLGAGQVVVIDRVPERLEMAQSYGAQVVNFDQCDDVTQALKDLTDGRGPDRAIDAVGLEAHPEGISGMYDKAKHVVRLESDRPTALRQVIQTVRKGGVVSIPGVYGGFVDKFPMGAAFNKALSFRMGQTHVHRYVPLLIEKIRSGELDPTFVITNTASLEEAPELYERFRNKEEGVIKVVLKP